MDYIKVIEEMLEGGDMGEDEKDERIRITSKILCEIHRLYARVSGQGLRSRQVVAMAVVFAGLMEKKTYYVVDTYDEPCIWPSKEEAIDFIKEERKASDDISDEEFYKEYSKEPYEKEMTGFEFMSLHEWQGM